MISDLKISLIQTSLHWEDTAKNLEMLSGKIDSIKDDTDLILLPEMFSTGFSMQPEKFSEKMDGPSVGWMKEKAIAKNCVVCGSLIIEEGGKYYNRLIWMRPDGTHEQYDKRHLFRYAKEDEHYTPGSKKIIVDLKGWKICPLVCYDLRFPLWSRNKWSHELGIPAYDILLYVANWPERRNHPWKTLLLARAIENQCYVIGLNRVGDDGNKIGHSGDSAVIDPKGEVISKVKALEEVTETVTLSYKELEEFRKIFPVGLDADEFEILY